MSRLNVVGVFLAFIFGVLLASLLQPLSNQTLPSGDFSGGAVIIIGTDSTMSVPVDHKVTDAKEWSGRCHKFTFRDENQAVQAVAAARAAVSEFVITP